jgi:hypothetical protein
MQTRDRRGEDRLPAMPSEEEVSSFIRSTFRSVWALELLCFLRQDRERSLSHEEMVAGLRGSDLVVTQSVDSLTAAGLVVAEADGSARYNPATEGLDRLVEAASVRYARSPDAVRRTIVAAANPAITAFADAFRLRRD